MNPEMKKKVAIEDVLRIQKEREAINRIKFSNIIWTKNGEEFPIDSKIKDKWDLSGLNNCDFITSKIYRTGWRKYEYPP